MRPEGSKLWPRLAFLAVVELAYALGTRILLRQHTEGVMLELLTTVLRVACISVLWRLFRELILSRLPGDAGRSHPLLLLALAISLVVPVVVEGHAYPLTAKLTFAATSIIVAIHEEFLFRGVLQNLLERRFGRILAITCSSAAFSLFHYGTRPFWVPEFVSLFLAGCLLALLYDGTGSLVAVIALHTVWDILYSFGPLLSAPWPFVTGLALDVIALYLLALWTHQRRSASFAARPRP